MSLELAVKHALKNPIRQRGRNSISRFGAVLTNGKRYIWGWNSYKSHPFVKQLTGCEEQVCVHAEVACLIQLLQGPYTDLSGYTMYVARILKDGSPAIAEPCRLCKEAIDKFGVGDCKWTI